MDPIRAASGELPRQESRMKNSVNEWKEIYFYLPPQDTDLGIRSHCLRNVFIHEVDDWAMWSKQLTLVQTSLARPKQIQDIIMMGAAVSRYFFFFKPFAMLVIRKCNHYMDVLQISSILCVTTISQGTVRDFETLRTRSVEHA